MCREAGNHLNCQKEAVYAACTAIGAHKTAKQLQEWIWNNRGHTVCMPTTNKWRNQFRIDKFRAEQKAAEPKVVAHDIDTAVEALRVVEQLGNSNRELEAKLVILQNQNKALEARLSAVKFALLAA